MRHGEYNMIGVMDGVVLGASLVDLDASLMLMQAEGSLEAGRFGRGAEWFLRRCLGR